MNIISNKEKFIDIYKDKIKRDGADKLLSYLLSESCDFFSAPASTKFHGNYEGGLLEHSLNVYECLCDIMKRPRIKEVYGIEYNEESIAIAALLHDICKTNFYRVSYRNAKNPEGKWESVPYYTIEDSLPYGHGEKSVYIISGYMKLTRDEAFAIRYHMGFSDTEKVGDVGKAMEMFPLAFFLNCADSEAAYYMEETKKN